MVSSSWVLNGIELVEFIELIKSKELDEEAEFRAIKLEALNTNIEYFLGKEDDEAKKLL